MSRWSVLGTNTWIAYNDIVSAISDGVCTAIGSAPGVGGETWLTSSQLTGWVGALSAPGVATQWVTKGTLTLAPMYAYTFYFPSAGHGSFWSNSLNACTGSRSYPVTLYSTDSPLVVGSIIYTYSGSTVSVIGVGGYPSSWAYVGSTPVQFGNDGTLAAITSCTYNIYWNVYNVHANSHAVAYTYNNGTPTAHTSTSSGSFTISAGQTIRATDVVSAGSGYSQSVSVSGGITFSAGPAVDTSYDSGTLTPSGDCTINIYLS